MEIIGWLSAIIIGVVLGLIGGGGSILTLPVLVYLLGQDPVQATAYSLFIVGITALAGSFQYQRQGLIDWRSMFIFAIPALLAVYSTRLWIIPGLPDNIFESSFLTITKSMAIMLLFAILMLIAAYTMIKSNSHKIQNKDHKKHYGWIILEGIFVGFFTGLVGAGGGFLIIPALVILGDLPMKKAIGTSLLIIAVKSLFGFVGDVQNLQIDWIFLIYFSIITISGIFIGNYVQKFLSNAHLKPIFGWFLLVMGSFIIVREII